MKYNAEAKWREIYESSSDDWMPQDFQDVIDFTEAWDLPDKYCYVVRVFNRKKGKVKETTFTKMSDALPYIKKAMSKDYLDVTFYDNEGLRSNCLFSDVS